MNGIPLNVLIVEDSEADARLVSREIQLAGFDLTMTRVETESDYRVNLANAPDIILSDFSLPQFDAMLALKIVRETGEDVPFLIVSGTIGEELAVQALRNGANDYLLKDRLSRLGTAVKQALEQRRLRETERQARRAEAEISERLKLALAAATMGVWEWNLVDDSMYWSPELLEIFGIEQFDESLSAFQKFLHPDDFEGVMTAIKCAIESREVFSAEFRITRNDGQIRWLFNCSRCEYDRDGKPKRVVGTARDITIRKVAEKSLELSEARLRRTFDQMIEGCQIIDFDYRYVYLNANALLHARRNSNEMVGKYMGDVFPGIEKTTIYAAIRECMEKRLPQQMEERFEFPDGSASVFELRIQPAPEGVLVFSYDITEREKANTELRDSRERLELLSRQLITVREKELRHLARELHDEIGQMLTAMKMNIRGVQRSVDETLYGRLEENVSMIDQAVEQVRNMSLNMRPPHLDDLGLAATLHWYLKHQAKNAGFRERLSVVPAELHIPLELATVCFRITQEAVTNAIRHANPKQIAIELRQNETELYLSIRDDGPGFDVNHARHRALSGASLGLISMQERASLAGGHIEIESTPGEGTTIHAWFPLLDSKPSIEAL